MTCDIKEMVIGWWVCDVIYSLVVCRDTKGLAGLIVAMCVWLEIRERNKKSKISGGIYIFG
jgi:hypothetical protein